MDAISGLTPVSQSRSKTVEDYAAVEDITTDMDALEHENFILSQTCEVLERYLRKRSPAVLAGMEKCIERSSYVARVSLLASGRSMSIASTKSSPSPGETGGRSSATSSEMRGMVSRSNAATSYKINTKVKVDMVERELEENRVAIDKLRKKFQTAKFLLQTEEENLRIEIQFLEESKITIEDLLTKSTDGKNDKMFLDRFLRFLEHEREASDRYMRKIKLKTKSLYHEYKRLLAQQQAKLELRERLHPIDIKKLLIENEERLDILELKNNKFQDLKKIVGKKGQTLVSVKSKLNDKILSLKNLKQDLEQKKTKCNFIQKQEYQNQSLSIVAEQINHDIRKLNMTFKSPDVHSYLQVQTELQELTEEKETWARRCKYQSQQISLLEHQVKQLSFTPRSRTSSWRFRSSSPFSSLTFESKSQSKESRTTSKNE